MDGLTLRFDDVHTNADDVEEINAYLDGAIVGTITFNAGSGTIDNLEVAEQIRRRGIATALWAKALDVCPNLRHDGDEITISGLAWALHVGGPWNTGRPPTTATR